AQRQLDFDRLQLKPFAPGVAVRANGRLSYISDPIRRPQDLLSTLTSPVVSASDHLKVIKLFLENKLKGTQGIFESPDISAIEFLKSYHFSKKVIERFFRPFFAGACLDPDIKASSRVFRYLFNTFASGDATLPVNGMTAIPKQLAETIPQEQIRLGTKVDSIDQGRLVLENGQTITGKSIVIATEGPETQRLLNEPVNHASKGEKCLYFSAETPPINKPFLILNGEPTGIVNNLAVPTLTAPSYSSSGAHLIAAVVLKHKNADSEFLEASVREELSGWFGKSVQHWKHLKTYNIDHGLPDQSPPVSNPTSKVNKVRDNIYICGEYQSVPGIQWALLSGRMTAETVIEDSQTV
ncbi:MAG: FAD-dependent oxidoreductase, partial [Desulfobacterales bacterium]|nr:FAD-dependent oxidoreductase [Desulfobacterales bacterium]